MTIQRITRDGRIACRVQIPRREFPSTFKTFDRYGDDGAFEDQTLR